MKKTIISLVVLATVGGGAFAYYRFRQTPPKVSVTTTPITRGDVVERVGATGTLQAVTTVQVGTQVSGTIQSLYADFNSLVKKGQVLARLDPSLFATQIEQAKANLIRSQADLERLKVTLDDARMKLARARELSGRQLLPKSDLDTAEVNVRSAEAQIRSSEAQVTQAQASLNQNEVNLEHTVITAPIDGLVISRSVDTGQTVAASMQAPTLFILAADLTKMQVVAALDESDVGRIRPKQRVTFRVDAYPTEDFVGSVSQVRLEPKVQQNVVTYATVIDVPNNELKLKPGMTANVNIEIAHSSNVIRVPNGALRFRPTNDMYTALGQTPPEGGGRGGDRGGDLAGAMRRGGTDGPSDGSAAAPAAAPSRPPAVAAATPERGRAGGSAPLAGNSAASTGSAADQARSGDGPRRGGRGGSPGGDQAAGGSRSERMQNLSPEEREQMMQRMRGRGGDPSAFGGNGGGRGNFGGRGRNRDGAPAAAAPAAPPSSARPAAATTIDALFGPLARVESNGRAYLYVDKQLHPVRLRLGISDGQVTEVIEGDVSEGQEVVTNVTTSTTTARPATNAFPFPGGPGFGPGGPGGGGGNRGGPGGGGGGNRGGGGR